MKILKMRFISVLLIFLNTGFLLNAQDPKEIVRKADEKISGEKSSQVEMTMKIVRPTWERTVIFKSWSKGKDRSLTLVTYPAGEKGQTFLKLGNEMWNWNPSISRMIKLPPSMMSQGWMGSDYSNDDVMNESSLVEDYTHSLKGSQVIENRDCHIIELIPGKETSVVWGKINMWIDKADYLILKTEFYDEDNYLVKTEYAYDVKKLDDRELPTRFIIQPEEEKDHRTIVTINNARFNIPVNDNFFSQQNMKTIR